MDNKITKTKLKTFFTYDFIKVVAVCVVLCLIFYFLYSFVEKKPTEGQRFTILYADDVVLGDESNSVLYTLNSGEDDNSFSYDILMVQPNQFTIGSYSQTYLLNTYTEVGDDDIFICADSLVVEYIESYNAQDLDSYIIDAFNYLYDNGFYTTSGQINQDKIIDNFIKKYGKDSRFKTKENLEKGKQLEIERIERIYKNATILKSVFDSHPEIFYKNEEGNLSKTGRYAINLGKLEGGEKNTVNSFYIQQTNEETNEVKKTSNGVYLLVGNNKNINGELHFESLEYIVCMLKTYSNLI